MRPALLALLLAAQPALAQKANGPDECMAFADMAIVAAALAKAKVQEPTMRNIIADIYTTNDSHKPMVDGIVTRAYASQITPKEFAQSFGAHCLRSGGEMKGFFGTAL